MTVYFARIFHVSLFLDQDLAQAMIASNQNLLYNNSSITLQFVKQFDQLLKKYIP
jgi:hypothetical protein